MRTSQTIVFEKQKLFGILQEASIGPEEQVVLFLHGFGGNKVGKKRLFVEMAELLAEQGISSFRFDFRGAGDSEGRFQDQTISTMLQDMFTIYDHLKTKRLIVIGTSLGGLLGTLLSFYRPLTALVLWAPVFNGGQWQKEWHLVPPSLSYVPHKGRLVSRIFFEEFFALSDEEIKRGLRSQPLLCVTAGQDQTLDRVHGEAYKNACCEGQFLHFPEADHGFSSYQDRQKLMKETAAWIRERV